MNTQTQEALKMASFFMAQESMTIEERHQLLKACKEALEQPAQEPVAYRYKWDENLGWHYSEYLAMRDYYESEALYTHPAPAKEPLSDDEIFSIAFSSLIGNPADFDIDPIRFTRAIEQAHGIGS